MAALGLTASEVEDSLTAVIAAQDKELARLKALAAKASAASSSRSSVKIGKSSEHEILAHYRQAVEKLPADLSPYERKVALRELRVETAGRFAISVETLDQIRQKNNLDY